MVVQAIVDHEYIFRDICVGWPGSVHDARIFTNSKIFRQITQDRLLADGGTRTILGCQVPTYIIGDSAYPIQTWLMKPFYDLQSNKMFQLSPLSCPDSGRKCLWTAQGKMETTSKTE